MNMKVETREEKFLSRFKIEGELIFTSATRYPVFLDKFPNFAAINYRRKWRGSEAANENKHGERRVGEKEKRNRPLPPVPRTPRQWVAINPNSGLLIMHADELFGCPVFRA